MRWRLGFVEGARGSDSSRLRIASPTATHAEGAQGNWCASVSPQASTCRARARVGLQTSTAPKAVCGRLGSGLAVVAVT